MSVTLPDGLSTFLETAGWADAAVEPLAGDASFRRYFRVRKGERTAMLMDAPPPNEDPRPFLRAAKWLDANGMRAPHVLAENHDRGHGVIDEPDPVALQQQPDGAEDRGAPAEAVLDEDDGLGAIDAVGGRRGRLVNRENDHPAFASDGHDE